MSRQSNRSWGDFKTPKKKKGARSWGDFKAPKKQKAKRTWGDFNPKGKKGKKGGNWFAPRKGKRFGDAMKRGKRTGCLGFLLPAPALEAVGRLVARLEKGAARGNLQPSA